MRVVSGCFVALVTLCGTVVHASDRVDLVKVKTGILPNGGFYSLYEADCRNQETAAVASLIGKRLCRLPVRPTILILKTL